MVSYRIRFASVGSRPVQRGPEVEGFRVVDWVGGDVIGAGVVDLAADAGGGDLVDLAHTLPASSQVFQLCLRHLT